MQSLTVVKNYNLDLTVQYTVHTLLYHMITTWAEISTLTKEYLKKNLTDQVNFVFTQFDFIA